ncbi:putative Nudix hydrolase [Alicyclobacillus acidoterrestris]|nr:putative Nudix hydrolase [Alicyclobacillus acidoterrestris]
MTEWIDIYNEDFQHIGAATREEVHAKGYWHKTFHCWVVMQQAGVPYIIFQKRHPNKDTNPNKLDVSCAGHLSAGENVSDGVRELREELSIDVPFTELSPLGIVHVAAQTENIRDFEACHIFMHVTPYALSDLHPQTDEISALYLAQLTDAIQLFRGEKQSIRLHGYTVNDSANRLPSEIEARLEDFVAHTTAYYTDTFEAIQAQWSHNTGLPYQK